MPKDEFRGLKPWVSQGKPWAFMARWAEDPTYPHPTSQEMSKLQPRHLVRILSLWDE
jgi:hypothetical protein